MARVTTTIRNRRVRKEKVAKGLCVTGGCNNKVQKPQLCEKCRNKKRDYYYNKRAKSRRICNACGDIYYGSKCMKCYRKNTRKQI